VFEIRKPKDLNGIDKIGTDNNLVDYTVQIAFVFFFLFLRKGKGRFKSLKKIHMTCI